MKEDPASWCPPKDYVNLLALMGLTKTSRLFKGHDIKMLRGSANQVSCHTIRMYYLFLWFT